MDKLMQQCLALAFPKEPWEEIEVIIMNEDIWIGHIVEGCCQLRRVLLVHCAVVRIRVQDIWRKDGAGQLPPPHTRAAKEPLRHAVLDEPQRWIREPVVERLMVLLRYVHKLHPNAFAWADQEPPTRKQPFDIRRGRGEDQPAFELSKHVKEGACCATDGPPAPDDTPCGRKPHDRAIHHEDPRRRPQVCRDLSQLSHVNQRTDLLENLFVVQNRRLSLFFTSIGTNALRLLNVLPYRCFRSSLLLAPS